MEIYLLLLMWIIVGLVSGWYRHARMDVDTTLFEVVAFMALGMITLLVVLAMEAIDNKDLKINNPLRGKVKPNGRTNNNKRESIRSSK